MQCLNMTIRLMEETSSHVTATADHIVVNYESCAVMDIFVYDAPAARELAASLLEAANKLDVRRFRDAVTP